MKTPRQPNFIIIYADDLGFGDLNCYGATHLPTPNLDQMAEEGLRFTNSYATAATCTPSRLSLITGTYPWRNADARILPGDAPMLIAPGTRTVPSTLKEAGYATGVVGKWHMGLGDGQVDWNGEIRPSPLDVGFDTSFIMAATNDRVPCVYVDGNRVAHLDPADPLEVVYGKENPFNIPTGKTHPELLKMHHSDAQHYDTIVNGVGRIGFSRGGKAAEWDDETMSEVFLERAKAFVHEHREQPFFLYYALHQPHVPRIPSPRFAGTTEHGPRGDVIAELDWCVGELRAHLAELGLAEDTVVVFSSDNGPVLDDGYEDESVSRCGDHRPAGPLRGGKYSRFDGGTRVPMIAACPGRVPIGKSAALFSHVDFLRTFATMGGAAIPTEETGDSQDMSAALTEADNAGRHHLVTEGVEGQTVLRQGNWVYLPPEPGPEFYYNKGIETGLSADPQLYNLTTDVGQRTNVAAAQAALVKEMDELLGWVQQNPHQGG